MTFVGREQELDRLGREAALALDLSSGRSVFVQGSAGAGKSALIAEFLDRLLANRPGLTVGRGRCLQTFGTADPYLPFIEALRDLSDETRAGFVKKETLSQMIAELTPYWLSAIPMVGSVLSAGYATARKLGGNRPATDVAPSREALFIQYLDLLQGLAGQAPLVLFFDDLHWADQSSIALLNHISRGISRQPVLILATVRSDEAEREKHPIAGLVRELEREGAGTALKLGDLESATLNALLAGAFGGDVSEPLQRWIESTAGGNPFFATELVRLLKESGAVREREGEWHLTENISNLAVPRSAEAVIESRVQALDAEEVKVLQYASIEGAEFNSIVLADMLEEDELDLLERLEKLDRVHHLVRTSGELEMPDGEIATVLQFRNTLLQSVLYGQVTGKRRILLHRKAGECLERVYGSTTPTIAGKLARHMHQGRVKEKAFDYATAAAETARKAYAHWEAEEYYRIALQHSPGEAETLALGERLGDVYAAVGYYDRATPAYAEALALPSTDPRTALRLRRKLVTVDRRVGSVPAPVLLQRLRALISEADFYPEERCNLLLEVGFLPNAIDVIGTAGEAVRIAEAVEDPAILSKALEQLAWALVVGGDPRAGVKHLERAYEVAGGALDPVRFARYHNVRGVAYTKFGECREALSSFEQMLAVSEKLAEPSFISVACSNMGAELLKLGEFERAEEQLQRAFTLHRRRDRSYMLQSLFNLAKRAHWSGDCATAIGRYEELLTLARELDYWTSEAVANAGLGLCHLALGEFDRARHYAAAAAAVVADRQDWFEDKEFLELLFAKLEQLDGSASVAVDRLTRAAAILRESDLFAYVQISLELIRMLKELNPDGARAAVEELYAMTSEADFALTSEVIALRSALSLDADSQLAAH